MLFEIKSRFNGSVLFSLECGSLKLCVEAAVAAKAHLSGADLHEAHLSGADLHEAHLSGADLHEADLHEADLGGADLREANLRGADLREADLREANLRGANLSGADLGGADLRGADLTPIRDDLWAVLSAAPAEVPALLAAIKGGRINGRCYEGECACLVGTIANARGCQSDEIEGLRPTPSRPAERFFLGINVGDTPETSQFSALAAEWIETWLRNVRGAFGGPAAAAEGTLGA